MAGRIASRLLPPVGGVGAVLFATAWGIGLTTDSAAYIGAARGLLQGHGVAELSSQGQMQPMTHYAPLFPMLVAAISLLGADPLEGARWLNSLLFGANVFLTGKVIEAETGSWPSAAFGALVMLSSVAMLQPHSIAWSEPTFIFFSLLAILWLGRYLEAGAMAPLIAAAAAIGLAGLARYAGWALIPAGLAAIVLQPGRVERRKASSCALFAAVSAAPSTLWLLRNWAVAGGAVPGRLGWHPVSPGTLWDGLRTGAGFLGLRGGLVSSALAATAMAAIMVVVIARGPRNIAHLVGGLGPIAQTAWLFAAIHVLFLLASACLVAAAISFSPRLLGPAYLWAVVGGVCVGHRWMRHPTSSPRVRSLLHVAAAAFAAAQVLIAVPWLLRSHRDGLEGYTSPQWRESETLARVRALPSDRAIFSNGAPVIRLLLGRPAAPIPALTDPMSMTSNERYAAEIEHMRRRLRDSNGVVVYFANITWMWHIPTAAQLEAELGLRLVHRAADGTMYALPPWPARAGTLSPVPGHELRQPARADATAWCAGRPFRRHRVVIEIYKERNRVLVRRSALHAHPDAQSRSAPSAPCESPMRQTALDSGRGHAAADARARSEPARVPRLRQGAFGLRTER